MKGLVEQFEVVHSEDILVKAFYREKLYTDSGLVITAMPSVVNDRPTSGVIVKKGADVTELDIGDSIFFRKENGHDIFFDEEKNEWYILLDSSIVLGKLR